MHRLAQPVGATRQRKPAPALRQLGDAGQGGVAAGAIHQRRPQHGGGDVTPGGAGEHRRFARAQPLREIAFVRIGRTALAVDTGGTERDHALGLDRRCRVPAAERVQRPATEDRVDAGGQYRQRAKIAPQPVQARLVGLRLPRQRGDAPAVAPQQAQQRSPDLAAATEHQRVPHRLRPPWGARAAPRATTRSRPPPRALTRRGCRARLPRTAADRGTPARR